MVAFGHCVRQNNSNVQLFHDSFGGCMYAVNETFTWGVQGVRAYLVAKILLPHTHQRKMRNFFKL